VRKLKNSDFSTQDMYEFYSTSYKILINSTYIPVSYDFFNVKKADFSNNNSNKDDLEDIDIVWWEKGKLINNK